MRKRGWKPFTLLLQILWNVRTSKNRKSVLFTSEDLVRTPFPIHETHTLRKTGSTWWHSRWWSCWRRCWAWRFPRWTRYAPGPWNCWSRKQNSVERVEAVAKTGEWGSCTNCNFRSGVLMSGRNRPIISFQIVREKASWTRPSRRKGDSVSFVISLRSSSWLQIAAMHPGG